MMRARTTGIRGLRFPAKTRGLGVACFSGGSGAGAMLAPIVIAQVIIWGGWRSAFVVIGLLGFLWLPLWIWFYRPPDRHWLSTPEELSEIQAETGGRAPASAEGLSESCASG